MKKIIIAFGISAVLLASCKEKAPLIKLTDTVDADSVYQVSPVPAAEPHNVLVEEFTGQSCSNCPAAHQTLDDLESATPGRLNVIGLYINNVSQTQPPSGARYDFRNAIATNISTAVYGGVSQLPNGGVERSPVSGSLQLTQGTWASAIANRMAITTPVNLQVESHYNSLTGDNTIVANIVYTQAITGLQNLSVVIVEDSIVDFQEYPRFHPVYPDGLDSTYVFTNVFRQMVSTAPFGDGIIDSVTAKTPGLALKHTYTYKLDPSILNPDHCRVIAFVASNNGTDYQVVQSAQVKLK